MRASEPELKSSLDRSLQQSLSGLLSRYGARLQTSLIHNAALVVIDNHTLLPVVYLGNLPQLKAAQAPHLDITQRPRSTGSLLKPILFASMLDAGELIPSSLVMDVPTTLSGFKPLNIDRRYRGVVSASEALIRSLNIPAVRMLQQHGVNVFYKTLSRLGLSLSRPAEGYGATLIIGGAEASLWSLSRMYALLAHKLLYPSLEESERVLRAGREGLTPSLTLSPLKRTLRALKAVPLSRGAIWQTFEVLTDVVRPREHQGWRQLKSAQRVAWKTGTSQGLRDAWAIGVTPRYTVGVWVGNAHGEGRPELTGTQAAAPLLFEAFKRLAARSSGAGTWFERPSEALEEVEVCVGSGYLPVPFCETERALKPKGAPFVTQDSFYQQLNLDSSGVYRVTSECWPVAEMRREVRFVLPPTVAWYHQKAGGLYEPLPPMHPQCETVVNPSEGLSISYPAEGAQLYLPIDLNGSLGEVVARVESARPTQPLYWHLDGEYLAMTRHFHELALSPNPGPHTLVVVSAEGGRVERRFKVLDIPR